VNLQGNHHGNYHVNDYDYDHRQIYERLFQVSIKYKWLQDKQKLSNINCLRKNFFILKSITQENGTEPLITILLLSTTSSSWLFSNNSGIMCKTASLTRAKYKDIVIEHKLTKMIITSNRKASKND
jgi:hypothetical protein